ncbi:hypothetical protein [Tamlana crocina]|uniref:DinB-like domain-containing protein n=1 Tax=Tamlana crocina TaxID=393006 RepID=A0ABX1DE56_9FLAO|nr:hypothetical protein [Tamlana crocina]NJX16629.1 hypothetical protein [Tamlana crocina]
MKNFAYILFFIISTIGMAQNENSLPYYEIPNAPESYSSGTVAARMVDGLGFRYYWATEGVRETDLNYKPSESGRTCGETIDHILELSAFVLNSLSEGKREALSDDLSFEEKRELTLKNLKAASDILKTTEDLSKFDNDRFPFWNLINGPISDAIWHCGQVVMLRRASGNPFTSKVSLFSGKIK